MPPGGDEAAFTRDEIDLVRHYRLIHSRDVREHLLMVAKQIGDFGGGATGSSPGAAKPA